MQIEILFASYYIQIITYFLYKIKYIFKKIFKKIKEFNNKSALPVTYVGDGLSALI